MAKQTTRLGYEYQDLIALCELLGLRKSPDPHAFIEIDSNSKDIQSLEDIAITYQDGSLKLIQSKYSAAEKPELLSWEFLLYSDPKKRKATSMIFKWQKAVVGLLQQKKTFTAHLYTNKAPDEPLSELISNNKISWSDIPSDIKTRLLQQNSVEENWKIFFENFIFNTNMPGWEELDSIIETKISDLNASTHTFSFIKDRIRHKAIFSDDKKIYLRDLETWLSASFSKLDQEFFIPDNYQIPDIEFYNNFLKLVSSGQHLIVLEGEAAIGKSTFLSNIKKKLDEDSNNVVLRHHYFISNKDQQQHSKNRLNYIRVMSELRRQLRTRADSDDFRAAIQGIINNGKKPIIILDGLDHVTRDMVFEMELEKVLNEILSLPTGTTIILGTQPLVRYPSCIDRELHKDVFLNFPSMSKEAIKEYLMLDPLSKKIKVEDIIGIVDTLKEKTKGNPEILRLFMEELRRVSEKRVDIYQYLVKRIPAYQGNGIKTFYHTLFCRLSNAGKRIIELLGSIDFKVWHQSSVEYFLKELGFSQNEIYSAIGETKQFFVYSGQVFVPNHESFILFAQNLVIDKTKNRKIIFGWLNSLPESSYWRVSYYKLFSIEFSQFDINEFNIDFFIDGVSRGYDIFPTINTLNAIETKLLNDFDLPNLTTIRHKKTRLLNKEFSIPDEKKTNVLTLALMEDELYFSLVADQTVRDNYDDLTIEKAIFKRDYEKYRRESLNLLDKKTKEVYQKQKLLNAIPDRKYQDEFTIQDVQDFIELHIINNIPYSYKAIRRWDEEYFVATKALEYKKIGIFKNLFESMDKIAEISNFDGCIKMLCLALSAERLPNISHWKIQKEPLEYLHKNSVFFNFWDYVNSNAKHDFDGIGFTSKVLTSLEDLYKTDMRPVDIYTEKWDRIENIIAELFLYNFLFRKEINIPKFNENLEVFNSIINILQSAALGIKDVSSIKGGGIIDLLVEKYSFCHNEINGSSINFKDSVRAIVDRIFNNILIFIYMVVNKDFYKLNITSFEKLSSHINISYMMLSSNPNNILNFNATCINSYIKSHQADEIGIVEIQDITERYVRLAELLFYANDINAARLMLRKAYANSLSYGNRKDPFASEVVDAIEECYKSNVGLKRDWDRRIATVLEYIDEYTDGKGTRHTRIRLMDLLVLKDISLASKYYKHMVDNDDGRSNDIFEVLVEATRENPVGKYLEQTVIDKAQEKQYTTSGETALDESIKQKVLSFPPEGIIEMLEYMRGIHVVYDYKYFDMWLDKWMAGNADSLIASIKDNFSKLQEFSFLYRPFDKIADWIIQQEGKEEGYKYLVASHVNNYGWDEFFSHGAKERLDKAATLYHDRWRNFIVDTSIVKESYKKEENNEIRVGTSLLVYFLLKVGEAALAEKVTEALLSSLEQDVAHLSLKTPTWIAK